VRRDEPRRYHRHEHEFVVDDEAEVFYEDGRVHLVTSCKYSCRDGRGRGRTTRFDCREGRCHVYKLLDPDRDDLDRLEREDEDELIALEAAIDEAVQEQYDRFGDPWRPLEGVPAEGIQISLDDYDTERDWVSFEFEDVDAIPH